MRNFTLGLLLLFSSTFLYGQLDNLAFAEEKLEQRGEIYFTFPVADNSIMYNLSRELSIDGFEDELVYAYANTAEFENFLTYGIEFTPVFEYYNSSKALTMATTVAEMASWNRYPTHAVYLQMMQDFVTNYPDLCEYEVYGYSENGVPIVGVVISDNIGTDEDEPEFWWSGTMHGDELVCYVLTLRMIDYLLSNYGTDPKVTNLIDNVEIYLNPLANPDGTFNGSPSLVSVSNATRLNTNGVDLNRNFPTLDGSGYTLQTESQAMMDYADVHDFVMSVNTHSGIELMNYPWDTWQSDENLNADDDWWEYVCFVYADEVEIDAPSTYFEGPGSMNLGPYNTTGVTHGADWYYAIGSRQDYMNYHRGTQEVTLEWSDSKGLDVDDLPIYWNYNKDAIMLYTEQCLFGLRGIVTDACTGVALTDVKVEIVGHDKDNSEVYSSAPVGNYHRPIYEGTYDFTFSITGYQSQTHTITITNDFSTRLDIQLIPDGTGTPNFTGAPTSIFEGEAVDYADASSGTITSRLWTFEGGSTPTSTATSPTGITYAAAGTYDVTLEIVSNGCTVSELKQDYITVAAAVPVVSNFVADQTSVPQGTTVNFTDLSINNPDFWDWTFDGGTPGSSSVPNPSVVYNTPGTYDVVLQATNTYGGNIATITGYITVTEADLLMSDGTSTRCSGLFKDSGGDGQYLDDETYTYTIYPATPGAFVRLTFTEFDVEEDGADCFDYITIYDGEDTGATEIGTYCNTDLNVIGTSGVVTSTDASGALTIYFSSDGGVTRSGWVAEISCYSSTDPPIADFSSDVTSTCTGIVEFEDQSYAATSWLWDFGDTNTSTEQNPQHTYTANGTYTVQLTVTNDYGTDFHTITDMIVVDMPVAPVTTGDESCGSATLTLSASGSGSLAWFDALTGGAEVTTGTTYTNAFLSTTTYYVQSEIDNFVTYSAGAPDNNFGTGGNFGSNNQHGLIFDSYQEFTLVSVYVYASGAGNRTITLTDASDVEIASTTINIPDGESRITLNFDVPVGTGLKLMAPNSPDLYRNQSGSSYPYTLDGVLSINDNTADNLAFYYFFYDWEVEVNEPCVSSRTPVVATINDIPSVDLGTPVTQCGGSIELDAGSGMTSYTWNGTLGAQTNTVSSTDNYSVVVENAEGCTATDNVDITINDVPATVIVSGGGTQCGGSMTLSATNGSDGTIYWQNTIPDGTSTTTASTSEIVSSSGTYYFRAQSAEGCWGDEGSVIVIINDAPATVIVSGGGMQCGGSMTLTADNGGEGTIYWQNTTSSGTSTANMSSSETVSVDGTYYFRAQSSDGCWGDEGSAMVIVEDNTFPTASNPIAINVVCVEDVPDVNVAVVTDEADDCTVNPIVVHVSDVSDDLTCPETITRTYSVSDDVGNTITVFQTIIINDTQNPTASNLPPILVASASAVPVANISDVTDEADNCTTSPIVTFVSDVSDGSTCPEIITRTYSVADDCGNLILITQSITINPTPAAVIVSGGGTQCGGSMTLTADNGGDGTIFWQNITSGGTSTAIASTSEIVSTSGTYYFRAQSLEGCWGPEGSAVVAIYPTLSASASAIDETGIGNNDGSVTVDMIGGTPDYDGVWTSGAPTNTSGTSMTQSDLTGGYYQVTVTDANGCTAMADATVNTAGAEPVADFAADNTQVCDIFTVSFEDLSNNTPTAWLWLFGDGETSDQENPIHTYTSVGIYTVSLEVTNGYGSDFIEFNNYISVGETPVLDLSMTEETVLGNDGTATVTITGGESPFDIEWSNSADSETITALSADDYCVNVTETYGCTASECITVTGVVLNPPVADFTADETEACGSLIVNFTDLSTNDPTSWEWNFGDGSSTSSDTNPIHTYSTPGVYDVSLTVENGDGDDYIEYASYITVYEVPVLSFDVTPESGVGMNDGEILMNITGGQGPYSITWSSSLSGNPIIELTSGLYSVVVEDFNGCMTSEIVEVPVLTLIANSEVMAVEIYPNPTDGKFTVKTGFIADEIAIIDALGRVILSEKVNNNVFNIDVELQPGIYFIKIIKGGEQILNKLIVE